MRKIELYAMRKKKILRNLQNSQAVTTKFKIPNVCMTSDIIILPEFVSWVSSVGPM